MTSELFVVFEGSSYHQMYELWQLPFVSKEGDIFEKHQELIAVASEGISKLSFVPFATQKSEVKKNMHVTQTLPANVSTTTPRTTSFFVELDEMAGTNGSSDPTATIKPLIDFNGINDGFDEVDHQTPPTSEDIKSLDVTKLFGTNDWTYQEETNKYIAKYNFHAEDSAELSVAEGTPVTVLRKTDKNGNSEWWYAEVNGQKGYIPQSYLIADNKKDLIYNRSKSSIMSVDTASSSSLQAGSSGASSQSSILDCDNSDFPAPPPELVPNVVDKHNKMVIGDNSVNKFNTLSNGNHQQQQYSKPQHQQQQAQPQPQQQQQQHQHEQQQQQQQ